MLSKKTIKKLKGTVAKINWIQVAGLILIFSVLLVLFSAAQISPLSFKNFDRVCQHFNYQECMAVFWQQKSYYKNLLYVGLGLTFFGVTGLVFSIVQKLRKR